MIAKNRNRDSVGKVLYVLRECTLFHVEAAISNSERGKTGIRSESTQTISDSNSDNMLECTTEGRVLSLSDHKCIAQLQAALDSVVNVYNAQNEREEDEQINRNWICAMAGAVMMQSLRDCMTSRANCCIWGPEAKKLHVLLEWMMKLESHVALPTRDYISQLLLQWIQPSAEKQNQLAACLTLFELLHRRRRRLQTFASDTEITCLFGDRASIYLDAMRVLVDQGTIQIADSHHVKPSKLALVALEALALLCGDIVAQYMTSSDETKRRFVDKGPARKTVECMQFVLTALRQWHMHSVRRQFLGYALQHLQSYVTSCHVILLSAKEVGDENAHGTILNDTATLDVLCWHWQTTVPLLCTRTDARSRLRKTRPPEVLTSVLETWAFSAVCANAMHGSNNTAVINPEVIYAQLRYVCILMDLIGGVKGCSKAFDEMAEETKAYFVFFFVQGLSMAIKDGAEGTVFLILQVLRAVLLPGDIYVPSLLDSRDTEQELLSQLLRLHGNSAAAHDISDSVSQSEAELEFFVADFIISRNLAITELVRRVQDAYKHSNSNVLSLVRTILYQVDNLATQTQLHRHWREILTPEVVGLFVHENRSIRQLAISCLPSLDNVSCITELCTLDTNGAGTRIITLILGYLFTILPQSSLEVGVSWLIDACQFGSFQVPVPESLASPHACHDYVMKQRDEVNENITAAEEKKVVQEKLFSLCFGPNGWSKHLQHVNARNIVLQVLLRKIFESPRDAVLLRMLREFVACGWVDNDVFQMLGKQIVTRMMILPRLSEEHLNDSSQSAAKSLEGLLFSRLAPLLVLRMLPRHVFESNHVTPLPCGREDLDHLNEYITHQLKLAHTDAKAASEDSIESTMKALFHILGRSMVDPLEFKEVKMVASECLSRFSPPTVLPFVFAYLVAFLRETTPHSEHGSLQIVEENSVSDSCGLVTAKLMVYYLNRVFAENDCAYKDETIVSKALVVLIRIMEIPCVHDSTLVPNDSTQTDLQRGCIDCVALILNRLSLNESKQSSTKVPVLSVSSLMGLLVGWIFGKGGKGSSIDQQRSDPFISRGQELLDALWRERCHHKLSLQARICCCNILLSAISRAESRILASWKMLGFISHIAQALDSSVEDVVVAGGLQIIFSFLYKSRQLFSIENYGDLQLIRICFEVTAVCLETTCDEAIAMNGLKVAGALVGKFPGFLPPVELQQFIDRCLIKVRSRLISPAVSELAQSLLQAMVYL